MTSKASSKIAEAYKSQTGRDLSVDTKVAKVVGAVGLASAAVAIAPTVAVGVAVVGVAGVAANEKVQFLAGFNVLFHFLIYMCCS